MDEQALVNSNVLVLLVLVGIILTLALFGVLAVIISAVNYEENPVRDRLLMLKEHGTTEGATHQQKGPFDELKQSLITFSGPLARTYFGKDAKIQQEVKSVLTEAGLPDTETHVWQFLTQMFATGLVMGVLFGGLGLLSGQLLYMCMGALLGFLVGTKLPKMRYSGRAKKRKEDIRYKLPDTLDLMVVCVEAGLALDATITRVAEETENMAPDISNEFRRLNRDLNAGISRMEAFQHMGQRAGVDELRSLCAMIIQADKMGTSISDTLRVYADDLRTKRRQRAEELASKASIKMTFPLVFFIFPPLFIILMGPVLIKTFQQFFAN